MLHRDKTSRKMISASAQISALAYDAPEDTKEVVDAAQKLIFDVTNSEMSQKVSSLASATMNILYQELFRTTQTNQKWGLVLRPVFPLLSRRIAPRLASGTDGCCRRPPRCR